MRGYLEYLNQRGIITEARQSGFSYRLDSATKKLEIYAEGANGGVVTKLIKEYKIIIDNLKELEDTKSQLQPKIKRYIKDIIDVEEEINAIVLKSAKASYELAKSSVKVIEKSEVTDYAKVLVDLQEFISADASDKYKELNDVILEIKKKYTTEIQASTTTQDFMSKREGRINVDEGVTKYIKSSIDKIIDYSERIALKFKKYILNLDSKLNKIIERCEHLTQKK